MRCFLDTTHVEQPHGSIPRRGEGGVWTLPKDTLRPTHEGSTRETVGPRSSGRRGNGHQGAGRV